MAIKTPEEFRESLRDDREVYIEGEKVDDVTAHPKLKVAVETAAFDYFMPEMPEYRDLAVVKDEKTGEEYSRYFFRPKTGDDLLKLVAKTLNASIRTSDVLCRIGGDEFTIILSNLKKDEDCQLIVQKITKTLTAPFIL